MMISSDHFFHAESANALYQQQRKFQDLALEQCKIPGVPPRFYHMKQKIVTFLLLFYGFAILFPWHKLRLLHAFALAMQEQFQRARRPVQVRCGRQRNCDIEI
jgi:hypothetical protein